MRVSGFLSASSRRMLLGLGLAATLCAAASGVSAAQAAGGQAAPPDPFKFTTDAMAIIWNVNSDKAGDFESVWNTVRSKLVASDKPDLKDMGTNLRLYKLPAGQGPTVSYLMFSDPASKTTYQPSPFLFYESGLFMRAEAEALYNKLAACLPAQNAINPIPLTKVAQQ
jgi:hypothetical protein